MAASATTGMPAGVRVWVCGLTAVAALGVALTVTGHDVARLATPLGLALVAGIAVAEVCSVWESGRPRTVSLTVSEVFVGIALVALPLSTVVLVCVLGSLATLGLRFAVGPKRGDPLRSPLVAVHGVALPVVRCLAAVAVVASLGDVLAGPVAAVLGIVAWVLVDGVATATVVRLETGLSLRDAVGETVPVEVAVALGTGAFGVALGVGIAGHDLGWAPVVGVGLLVLVTSHAGTTWSRERRRSALVLDVVRATGQAAGEHGRVAEVLVTQVGAALHAARVELTAQPPAWAAITAPLGGHGWIGVADRTYASQALFDRDDQDLLSAVASVATIALDNAVLVARLADEERLRSTLLAAAAHDLRSPLALASGALQAVGPVSEDGAPAHQLLRLATSGVERASRLVHDLIVLEREHVVGAGADGGADVAGVLDAVLGALPPGSAVRCSAEVEAGLPQVAISPVLLERVVDNLVGNALKHTAHDGPVRVWARAVAGEVELSVDDRGKGVPADQRDRVLAPFATASTSTSGVGLGLHIAVEFVRRAGGTLEIHDRDDGPGASFRVRLPVVASVPAAVASGAGRGATE